MFLYSDNGDYNNALKMNYEMLKIRQQMGDTIDIARTYNARAFIHDRMGNFDQMLYYANKALEISRRERLVDLLPCAYETMAYVHAVQGDVESFSQAMAASRHYRDSIFSEQRFAVIQELQTRFQTEQKQQEIIAQQQEIRMQRITIFSLISICTLIATLLILLYLFYQKKLRHQIQIIRQHEELSNYVRKGQQPPTEKSVEIDEPTEPDERSKTLLTALDQLFESEKLYRTMDLDIVEVADKLNTNRTYLSKVINQYHQKNFPDYVNYYRIEEAKEMFKAQLKGKLAHYTNETIAEKVGFGSSAQFYRAFSKVVGVTSGEYKKTVMKMVKQ
jgi:AraC-like DNA-binding protein